MVTDLLLLMSMLVPLQISHRIAGRPSGSKRYVVGFWALGSVGVGVGSVVCAVVVVGLHTVKVARNVFAACFNSSCVLGWSSRCSSSVSMCVPCFAIHCNFTPGSNVDTVARNLAAATVYGVVSGSSGSVSCELYGSMVVVCYCSWNLVISFWMFRYSVLLMFLSLKHRLRAA